MKNLRKREGGFSNPPINYGGRERPPSLAPSAEDVFAAPATELFVGPSNIVDVHARHLPHWHQAGLVYFVTWHTADALPRDKLDELHEEKRIWLAKHPKPWNGDTEQEYHDHFTHRTDKWLDAGHGACLLRNSNLAQIVADSLLFFDGQQYDVASFVVMPNHVHVLFRLQEGNRLEKVIKSWKGYAGREINKSLGQRGVFWQDEYWDRAVRSDMHFARYWAYIRENPARAKLREGEFFYYAVNATAEPSQE
jgi:REP element-mobilizing transposase RayT